jgi:D,D-heptose 1,7-bisphosphate phosphatase
MACSRVGVRTEFSKSRIVTMVRQAAILVGGLGTRLKHLTEDTPKPMLPVGGRPFLEYLFTEIARYGLSEIVLLAGFRSEQVLSAYDGISWKSAQIRVVAEQTPLGTGGAVRAARAVLDDRFLLLNGDSYFDIDLRRFINDALSKHCQGHIALRDEVEGDRYGRIEQRPDGSVARFLAAGTRSSGPINAGIYCLDQRVIDRIPPGRISLETDVLPTLAAEGQLSASSAAGYFIDMGVPADFERAQTELPAQMSRPAAFLDRDGVLNVDKGYVHTQEEFEWRPGSIAAVRRLNELGFYVFVVTNQAGVARGYYDEAAIEVLHHWMNEELGKYGAHSDAFEYCPHHLDGVRAEYRNVCRRRKPEAGMLLDLIDEWPVLTGGSFLIGDKQSDLDAAAAAGLPGYVTNSENLADFVDSLPEVVRRAERVAGPV